MSRNSTSNCIHFPAQVLVRWTKRAAMLGWVICGLLILSESGNAQAPNAGASAEPLASTAPDDFPAADWQTVTQICDLVQTRHFQPPARQQLMLSAARGIYRAFDLQPPADLADEFSRVTSDSEFRRLLDACYAKASADSQRAGVWDNRRAVMVARLIRSFDPNGRWLDPKTLRVEKQLAENRYVGIGIQVAWNDPYCEITEPFIGGAARAAGAKPGDLIVEIEGQDCVGRNLPQIIDDLRGAEGTRVVIKVRNKADDEEQVRTLDMVRTTIPLATVQSARRFADDNWDYRLSDQHPRVAYLRFDRITGSSAAELKRLAAEIESQQFDRVFLDFTRVGQADFHYCLMIADALCGQHHLGTLRQADSQRSIASREDHVLMDLPITAQFRNSVDGSLLLIATAVLHRQGKLVGPTLTSTGIVGERLDIGEVGAISFVSTSRFDPNLPSPESAGALDINGQEQLLLDTFVIPTAADNLEALLKSDEQNSDTAARSGDARDHQQEIESRK